MWSFDSTCLNEIRLARYNYEIDAHHDALCQCQDLLEKGSREGSRHIFKNVLRINVKMSAPFPCNLQFLDEFI